VKELDISTFSAASTVKICVDGYYIVTSKTVNKSEINNNNGFYLWKFSKSSLYGRFLINLLLGLQQAFVSDLKPNTSPE